MLGYDAWRIPSAAYLAVARALLAAKFAELRKCEVRPRNAEPRTRLPKTPAYLEVHSLCRREGL
jgi:hypothetical protein